MDGSWFHQALERVNATQADLARHLRLAPSAVSRMMKGERQMKLLEAVQIAGFLGVSQEEVLRHAGDTTVPPPAGEMPRGRGRPPSTGTSSAAGTGLGRGVDQIPIRSAARGGGDQEMFLEDGPIGYTPRPANLGGVRSAYAIYMVGDSMEPRYQPGWLLHVNPFKPPTDQAICQLGRRHLGPASTQPRPGSAHPARRGTRVPPRRRRRSGGVKHRCTELALA